MQSPRNQRFSNPNGIQRWNFRAALSLNLCGHRVSVVQVARTFDHRDAMDTEKPFSGHRLREFEFSSLSRGRDFFQSVVCGRKVRPPSSQPSPPGRGRYARPRLGNLRVLLALTVPLVFALSRAKCWKPFAVAERGQRFSLSLGERAGVRAGVTHTRCAKRNHSNAFVGENLFSHHPSPPGFSVVA